MKVSGEKGKTNKRLIKIVTAHSKFSGGRSKGKKERRICTLCKDLRGNKREGGRGLCRKTNKKKFSGCSHTSCHEVLNVISSGKWVHTEVNEGGKSKFYRSFRVLIRRTKKESRAFV